MRKDQGVLLDDDGELFTPDADYLPGTPSKQKRNSLSYRSPLRLSVFILALIGVTILIPIFIVGVISIQKILQFGDCPPSANCPIRTTLVVVVQVTIVSPRATAIPILNTRPQSTPAPTANRADPACTPAISDQPGGKIAYISNRQAEFGAVHLLALTSLDSCLLVAPKGGVTRLIQPSNSSILWVQTSLGWKIIMLDGRLLDIPGSQSALASALIVWFWKDPAVTVQFFDREMDGNRDIYASNAGGLPIRLTDHPARDFSPMPSLDATQIAFVSYRMGNNELYLMNADGSNMRRLTSNLADDTSPVWIK